MDTAGLAQVPLGRFGDSALEVAYATRWIELDAGSDLRGWHTLCRAATR